MRAPLPLPLHRYRHSSPHSPVNARTATGIFQGENHHPHCNHHHYAPRSSPPAQAPAPLNLRAPPGIPLTACVEKVLPPAATPAVDVKYDLFLPAPFAFGGRLACTTGAPPGPAAAAAGPVPAAAADPSQMGITGAAGVASTTTSFLGGGAGTIPSAGFTPGILASSTPPCQKWLCYAREV